MADYPYTTVPGKMASLLEKIRATGVPQKATNAWLKTIGFKSSNDSTLLPIIKFIDLCDQSGTPTDRWRDYRGGHHASVLADAIRTGYSELFDLYPDAHSQSDTDLDHFFSTRSSAGKQVISKTISTFKALCAKADFGAPSVPQQPITHASTKAPQIHNAVVPNVQHGNPHPEIHIDIQIHISPEASTDQIDQIFKSMRTHLYGSESNS